MLILTGLLVVFLGVLPLLLVRNFKEAMFLAVVGVLVVPLLIYGLIPSFALPFFGVAGIILVFLWIAGAGYAWEKEDGSSPLISSAFPVILLLAFGVRGCAGSEFVQTKEYSNLIGQVEKRVWTKDVQPQDPKHLRLVPKDNAVWAARKQLGQVEGAIGSQFEISESEFTLQRINGELWYVTPLDFSGLGVWWSKGVAPGYVKVHAEDPRRPAIVVTGLEFRYTPEAFFSKDLERHLWENGYAFKGLTDYSLEIDEAGKPWWVVTVYKPTLAWWGDKALGVAIVDPRTGDSTFHEIGKVPEWVDRVVPSEFIASYIQYNGSLKKGWWNSFWTKDGLTEPEEPRIVYGADGDPYWVTGVTSQNRNDDALVGVYYTDSRTGKSVFYSASGGTDAAVLGAVDSAVGFKRWHGADPVLCNIYDTMASVVPVLGENYTFQSVAIVNVKTLGVAVGDDAVSAYRNYQVMLSKGGEQIAPETAIKEIRETVTVTRIASEIKDGETIYYLYSLGKDQIFTGQSELSAKLPVTLPGDQVEIRYPNSDQDVVPLTGFDNSAVMLRLSANQLAVKEASQTRDAKEKVRSDASDARGQIQNMSNTEVQALLELRAKQHEER